MSAVVRWAYVVSTHIHNNSPLLTYSESQCSVAIKPHVLCKPLMTYIVHVCSHFGLSSVSLLRVSVYWLLYGQTDIYRTGKSRMLYSHWIHECWHKYLEAWFTIAINQTKNPALESQPQSEWTWNYLSRNPQKVAAAQSLNEKRAKKWNEIGLQLVRWYFSFASRDMKIPNLSVVSFSFK